MLTAAVLDPLKTCTAASLSNPVIPRTERSLPADEAESRMHRRKSNNNLDAPPSPV